MYPNRPGIPRGGPGRGTPIFNGNRRPMTNSVPAGQRGGRPIQPNQPCRFFMRGECKFGARCNYSHTLTRAEGDINTIDSPRSQISAATRIPIENLPGLSNDQFSKVETNLTPGQTFNSLKIYVEESFKFRTSEQVYQFLKLLSNASSQNPSWTAKDGQLHLHGLVKGNGIVRLAEAIRFPKETNRPWSFQRGYIPIFTYLASDWVIKSTLNSDVNALYGLVHSNFHIIRDTIETHMNILMAARSFRDKFQTFSGKQIFKVLFVMLFEYLTRFKDAPITNPGVREFAERVVQWFDEWLAALASKSPFQDECATYGEDQREFIIENLRRDKDRVLRLMRRAQTVFVRNGAQMSYQLLGNATAGLVAALERNFDFDGPGEFCESGPRHDNDHAEIELIRVAPTRDELLCEDEPYLPANFFEGPHFHDPTSIERLLDIQFRLLREELTSPIRLAVQLMIEDLKKSKSGATNLSKILNARGGRYAAPVTARESIIFSVFTNVSFQPLELRNRGISAGIVFDTPPGKGRNDKPEARAEYWEQVSKKRLMQDGLVALLWKDHAGNVDIYVGTVASFGRDLADCAKKPAGQDRVCIRVSFFDAKANIRIVQDLQNRHDSNDIRILIEAPVFYEGIRPFLEALKREPESLPFARYLRLQSKDELAQTIINPPFYSRDPRFSFELKDLFPPVAGVTSLQLNTRNPDSIANARAHLIQSSRLDPSQAEAMIDSLTREVALIQGPPGTGKSYTGLELIRVLVKNDIAPILLVAFTNHALDHMLNGILDAEITDKIVRLGSQSSIDERLSKYTLEKVEKEEAESRLAYAGKSVYREMKILESDMKELMNNISSHKVPSSHIEQHISPAYPHHHGEFFQHVPGWIGAIAPKPSDAEEGWTTVGESPNQDESIIDFWLKAGDLQFLEANRQKGTTAKAESQVSSSNQFNRLGADTNNEGPTATGQNFLRNFMREHGLKNIPKVPGTNRPLDILLKDPKVWRMSRKERTALHEAWSIQAIGLTQTIQIQDFEDFRQTHEETASHHKEITDQLKAEILSRSHIVGCTTTGAAKLVSLLSGMGPKVMIVEEAGQVLEAHILASLVGTVEHMVLIGDPLQLRPNINSYKLSTENPKTGKIYRFDQSLMERLSSGGFPMSQIDVQRRMRPQISSLIRNTLYPNLQDNERVLSYPNVRGMHKNVFFVSHTHKEVGGGEDAVSKHNSYEIDMIYDLVLHLMKQGSYNKPGNIVILAAYLGQIPKLRKKLQEVVTIVIDERDAELLEQQTMDQEETGTIQKVQLSKQVIIRTLDNFQGEEGEVIILSLVRNSGTFFDEETSSLEYVKGKAPIGFLRSLNRTNVGLSRAKHGLYIFGNAPELAQGSKMWSDVLKELQSSECIGPKLPIACHRHPDYVQWIEDPGVIPIVSPKGGCCRPCGEVLSCAHICPSLCHADDPNHISTKCQEPCIRLCSRSHPCDRQCWECSTEMAKCPFPIRNLQLPCGHVHPPTQCYRVSIRLEEIKCPVPVVKQLPSCDHHATMLCHEDPASYACQERTSKSLGCGHRMHMFCHEDPAKALCPQLVEKELPCAHVVKVPCHQDISNYTCRMKVEKPLPRCDHQAKVLCHQDITNYTCLMEVEKPLPRCDHRAKMPCHQDILTYRCLVEVEKPLSKCDHPAKMPCHQDISNYTCLVEVEKPLSKCDHRAKMPCHQDISNYRCLVEVEKTLPTCDHRTKMPCHRNPIFTRFACQERVTRTLPDCDHSAEMLCRENVNTYACNTLVEQRFTDCDHRKQLTCHKLRGRDLAASQCQEQVEKDIPTCKHTATMPCHKDPQSYKCQKWVEKELPFCEHRASIPCYRDPEDHPCSETCGGALSCCYGRCSANCGACHRLNPDETGSGERDRHTKHVCNRRLACGHPCKDICSEDHVCPTLCKGKCQQSCTHSTCRQECSIPCKPCGKPCVWKCTHTKCTSPCGMACTRLPCDERCPNMLSCGHSCPSVCGEPCEYQTCKICSEEDTLDSVVDLLGQVCLRDLEDDDTLNSMTITLSCRHVFTVETLDSVTRIRNFYEQDHFGEWTKAIMPDASVMHDRPMCPRCGGGIDSLRYGRVLKRSNHSILQHNVSRSLSGQLSWAEERLRGVRDRLEQDVIEAAHSLGIANAPTLSEAVRRASLERINVALAAEEECPTSFEIIQNLNKFHGLPPRHSKAWRKAISEIASPYEVAYGAAAYESDLSVDAYEDSLERLYKEELKKSGGSTDSTADPTQRRLQQLATNVAHARIGHLRPRASDRFSVEGFWITIEILMLLGLAISRACEEIWQQNIPRANTIPLDHIANFLLLRASKDAETAYRLADESKSLNKALLCRVLILQTQYEHVLHKCRVAIRNGSLLNRETRDEYSGMCTRSIEQIRDLQARVSLVIPRESVPGENDMKAEWVGVYFVHPTQIILDAWNDLAQAIQNDLPAWHRERKDGGQLVIWHPIIQEAAAENRASHTEHFYQCPRGHPYTRGECATVLERIWCPECGITVGSSE